MAHSCSCAVPSLFQVSPNSVSESVLEVDQNDTGSNLSQDNTIEAALRLADEPNKGKTVIIILIITTRTNINNKLGYMTIVICLSSCIVTRFQASGQLILWRTSSVVTLERCNAYMGLMAYGRYWCRMGQKIVLMSRRLRWCKEITSSSFFLSTWQTDCVLWMSVYEASSIAIVVE